MGDLAGADGVFIVRDKVPLESPEGQKLLQETNTKQTLLIRLFCKQQNNTFCGIQSSALVMSARHLGNSFPEPSSHSTCSLDDIPYTEANMFSFEETKSTLEYAEIDSAGATMQQIYDLLCAHKLPVHKIHANESTVEEFRTLTAEALSMAHSQKGVILNYDELKLGQDDIVCGHFSVLAGYHAGTDRFLLLDTWFNTVNCWVKTRDLFRCMNTFDEDASKYRGFIIVG